MAPSLSGSEMAALEWYRETSALVTEGLRSQQPPRARAPTKKRSLRGLRVRRRPAADHVCRPRKSRGQVGLVPEVARVAELQETGELSQLSSGGWSPQLLAVPSALTGGKT